MAKLSKKIGKRCSKSQMARFMARNSKWPENIFYGQRGANMARLEKSGHQMARLATLFCAHGTDQGAVEARARGLASLPCRASKHRHK